MLPLRAALRARTLASACHRPPVISSYNPRVFSTHAWLWKDSSSKPEFKRNAPLSPDRLNYNPDRDAAKRRNESDRQESRSEETAEVNTSASPAKNTTPDRQPGPSITRATAQTGADNSEYSDAQEEFSGAQSAEANTAPRAQSADSAEEPRIPRGPLPDLRHGIPSTFAQEYMKQQGRTEGSKQRSEAAHHDVNITDDPAHASEEGAAGGASGGRDEGELPRSAYETSIDKRRNRVANWSYLIMALFASGGALYFGRNWETETEEAAHPEAPSGWGFLLFWNRIKARWKSQMGYYTEPTFPKLLPTMDPAPPYTLVLSLEDLMIHSEWTREHGWRTAKRPGLDYFLRYLSQYYELVLFTSMPLSYADQVVRKLDPYHIIMWPLFREATRYEKGEYIKDLSYLNRPLSKVIIMDTKAVHVKNQPENAIILPPWKGDPSDKDLVSYIPFLEYIASMGINDVRDALKSFEGKHIPTEYARREALLREEFNRQLEEQRAKKPKVSGLSFLNKALGLKPTGGLTMDGEHSVAEGLAEGKMLQDQIRERGMKQYAMLEKEIRENGEKWLKEEAEMEKKAQAEQMKSAKQWTLGFLGQPKDGETEQRPA